eukprot:UN09563
MAHRRRGPTLKQRFNKSKRELHVAFIRKTNYTLSINMASLSSTTNRNTFETSMNLIYDSLLIINTHKSMSLDSLLERRSPEVEQFSDFVDYGELLPNFRLMLLDAYIGYGRGQGIIKIVRNGIAVGNMVLSLFECINNRKRHEMKTVALYWYYTSGCSLSLEKNMINIIANHSQCLSLDTEQLRQLIRRYLLIHS